MRKQWMVTFATLLTLVPARARPQQSQADIELKGDVTGTQNKTYLEVPFIVPAGTHRISVDFHYTGSEQRATLDLGIADPARFRGASGGNKSHFTLSETDATPSYLPGAILPGTWKLLIAVPNLRPQTVSHYTAEIRFNSPSEDSSFTSVPLASDQRWYRGDLHMHTAHSDGSCASQSGRSVPCPVFLTAEMATARGLDFIAITDHNTTSQYDAMRELQPYFDKLLLIPGREITTFWGHFNIYGVTPFIDYRVTGGQGIDVNTILRQTQAAGGIASINHAEAPGGETCMGCRWEPTMPVDLNRFTSVEVINGGGKMFSSGKFWDAQLQKGYRLAGIGGSDNHNATSPTTRPGAIGSPTTVIQAKDLSVPAILDGIRAGRTFIDLTSSRDKLLDFTAESGNSSARMGGSLTVAANTPIHITVHVIACKGLFVHLLVDGAEASLIQATAITSDGDTPQLSIPGETGRHWLRLEVRDSAGKLQLLSSPIYINFSTQ